MHPKPDRNHDRNEKNDRKKRAKQSRFRREAAYCLQHAMKVPIPKLFRKSFGGYFRFCAGCHRPLRMDVLEPEYLADGVFPLRPYLIVKTVRHGEPWVEYAMCVDCADRLQSSLSRDSNARVDQLFDQRVNVRGRFDMLTAAEADPSVWISNCILTGAHRSEASYYQIRALCSDNDLLLSSLPYAVCGNGLRALEECHSAQSKKRERKFIKRCLGVEAAIYNRYPR